VGPRAHLDAVEKRESLSLLGFERSVGRPEGSLTTTAYRLSYPGSESIKHCTVVLKTSSHKIYINIITPATSSWTH
jgi:hypothetical protein